MKLLRLKLNSDFRSLKAGFEIKLRDLSDNKGIQEFQPFCFAGLNGSGKSNVLEALANIFYHLDLCANRFKPDAFKSHFNPSNNIIGPQAFELDYIAIFMEIDYNEMLPDRQVLVKIEKKEREAPQMTVQNIMEISPMVDIPIIAEAGREAAPGKAYLPELVVGYSSGENETLSLPFVKSRIMHLDEYIQGTLNGYKEHKRGESSLVYIDAEMSQAILLACMIYESEESLHPLKDQLGLTGIRSFRMKLNDYPFFHPNIDVDNPPDQAHIPVLEHIEEQINQLKEIATSYFEDNENYREFDSTSPERRITLDFHLDEAVKQGFKAMFPTTKEFFHFFQQLYELNSYELSESSKKRIYDSNKYFTKGKLSNATYVFYFQNFKLLKESEGEVKELRLQDLSDGEHQFLHTLGICLILKHERTLLLFDEPETHFNPDWRSKFINVLDKSIQAGGGKNQLKDILITSHSPFIISDCKKKNVFVFREGEVVHPKINTFGASVNLIMDEVFQKDDTISDFAKEELHRLRSLPRETLEQIDSVKNESRSVGESAEKVLLFRDLIVKENELKKNQ